MSGFRVFCVLWRSGKLESRCRCPPVVTKQGEINAAIHRVQKIVGSDVVRIRYEIGEDWSGQWAIFFRVVLTDDAAKRRLRDVATKVVWKLARELDFPGMGVFPYHTSEVSRSRRLYRNRRGPSR